MPDQRLQLCSEDGCGRPQVARSLCHIHYQRARRLGKLPPRRLTSTWDMLEVLAKALRHDSDECYLWPYGAPERGYGQLCFDRRPRLVHRFVCEVVYGPPPSLKHQAAHGCGVPACINPRHLRWDTAKGNSADRIGHGTSLRGEASNFTKLTAAQVTEIRAQHYKPMPELASEFGVDRSTISLILNRKIWRHI